MSEAPTEQDRHGIGGNNPPFEVELAERRAPIKLKVENLITRLLQVPAIIETPEQHDIAVGLKKEADDLLKDIADEHGDEKEPLAVKTRVIDAFFLTKGLKGRLEPHKNTIALRNGAYQDKLADIRRKEVAEAAQKAADEANAKMEEAAKLEAAGRHTEAGVKMEGAQAQEQHANALGSQTFAPQKDLGRSHSSAGMSSLIIGAKVVVDLDTIDLEKLRPFLALDALETAVRSMIRARGLKPQQLLDGALTLKGLTFERTTTGR